MRHTLLPVVLSVLFLLGAASGASAWDDCRMNGKAMYGKVQVVESFADFKVQVVNSFPDLDVQKVTSFPDACGQWQFVNSFPDFTIQYVESFPDLKIRFVDHFPGRP